MKRCFDPRNKNYPYYGSRGISVCTRWLTPKGFYKDMGDCPAGLSLDRIDNNKGYSPENCRWGTLQEQHNNRTNSRRYVFRGRDLTIAQWARELEMPYWRIYSLLGRHEWTIKEVVERYSKKILDNGQADEVDLRKQRGRAKAPQGHDPTNQA